MIYCGSLSLFASYAVLMGQKMAEKAVHDCLHSGSILLIVDSSSNARYQCGLGAQFSSFKVDLKIRGASH